MEDKSPVLSTGEGSQRVRDERKEKSTRFVYLSTKEYRGGLAWGDKKQVRGLFTRDSEGSRTNDKAIEYDGSVK